MRFVAAETQPYLMPICRGGFQTRPYSFVGVDAGYDARLSKLEAGKVLSCLRMQASPKAEQVKDTANAEIPAFAGMTEEKFSQLFDNVNPASSFDPHKRSTGII